LNRQAAESAEKKDNLSFYPGVFGDLAVKVSYRILQVYG
jgi:hypothetical protein